MSILAIAALMAACLLAGWLMAEKAKASTLQRQYHRGLHEGRSERQLELDQLQRRIWSLEQANRTLRSPATQNGRRP